MDIYRKEIIVEKILIPYNRVGKNMSNYFLEHATKHIEGKCRDVGYVKPHSTEVVSFSAGQLLGDSIEYSVEYSVMVYFPTEDSELDCIIESVSVKIGLRAYVSETNNPAMIFISKAYNEELVIEDYKVAQKVKVIVKGHRFEKNDEYITILGVINLNT
jgi:DNA-directed RNA polymerase subunit E'/Rpb7